MRHGMDIQSFWADKAQSLIWQKKFTQTLQGSLAEGNVRWFNDGKLNVCENCIDRHLPKHANKPAIIWEGDDPKDSLTLTFTELHQQVCQFANVLKSRGIQKGDRVCLYMPMIIEAAVAMLACARIGAIHSVVFGGFSPEALQNRILDCQAKCVITANMGLRGGKPLHFKANVDIALEGMDCVTSVIVVKHTQLQGPWHADRDVDYHATVAAQSLDCPCEPMNANDPLFILYTSGSTGKPKGIVHSSAGYLLYAAFTHQHVFQLKDNDIYWCTADVGWITGHSYVVYGPLANACTTLMFEGTPECPTPARYWEIVDKHHVSVFYTAPTAIRSIMRHGDEHLNAVKLNSLRVLGTVGEPINPQSWEWYKSKIGHDHCPIMDTWWQTETGGFMIAPPADLSKQKPGCAMQPCPGIEANIIDGELVISQPWPGMLMGIYKNEDRFKAAYLTPHPGHYTAGDGAKFDDDGDIWITGRLDDVLNVSGHRLGTAEIESALVAHDAVVEAAVVGFKHDIKGVGIYAYVTLMDGFLPSEAMQKSLTQSVRQHIGPIATPDFIQFTRTLPKTRSGKIMRRILRNIAEGEFEKLGDTSTLADRSCIADLTNHSKVRLT